MQAIKTYLLNCSFHGVPFVVDSRYHWTERIFWLISVIASWWAAVSVMLSAYHQFQENAISFTVDTAYLYWKSHFPALVLCEKSNMKYLDYANENFAQDRDFDTDDVLKDIVFFKGVLEGASFKCTNPSVCPVLTKNFTEVSLKIRSRCSELLGFCSWNDKPFNCCDTFLPLNTIYGVCYSANSLNSYSKIKPPVDMFVSYQTKSRGFLTVEIKNPDVKMFLLGREDVPMYSETTSVVFDGVSTSPHLNEKNVVYLTLTEMANEKEVESIDIQRRKCRFPAENYLKTSKVYSYPACLLECQREIHLKICNCTHHLMPFVNQENVCDFNGLICLTTNSKKIIEKGAECDCQDSCTDTDVKVIGSTSQENYTDFNNEDSTTTILFVMQAPTVQFIRKVVNGYLDLIVYMGGTAGLCVGASLLTGVEFIYYLLIRPFNDRTRRIRLTKNRQFIKRNMKPPYKFLN